MDDNNKTALKNEISQISDGVSKLFRSKLFKAGFWTIVVLILALSVFKAGMAVGFKKARFSYQWGENYHRNFAGPRGGFLNDFTGRDFIEPHGVFGQIIKIDPSANSGQAAIVIKGQDNVEKIVLVNGDTVIRSLRDTIKASDLKVDESIVVIGDPDDSGQIAAKLIRVMPQPFPYR